jgi:ribokinase
MTQNKNFEYDVVTVGSCTLDIIMGVSDVLRFELFDKNVQKKYTAIEYSSKINVNDVRMFPGGSAANIACDLAMIKLKTAYIGCVGEDSSGYTCIEDMNDHGVNTECVIRTPDDATAISIILFSPWGKDRSILAYKGANDLLNKEHIQKARKLLENTKAFAWTSLTSDSGIEAIEEAIKIVKAANPNALIAGAPSISIIKKRRDDAVRLMKMCNITSLNDEEALELTQEPNVHDAIQTLMSWGFRRAAITMGKNGSWLTNGKRLVKSGVFNVNVTDTTGAGDAFMSGVIAGTLMDKDLKTTAKMASGLSALEIMSFGVRLGMPHSINALETFINSNEIEQTDEEF